MNATAQQCSNADCHVAEDGKCVEGFALAECPHYGSPSVEDIEEGIDGPAATTAEVLPAFPLDIGEALDRAQTSAMQRRFPSRTIGIIGPHDSGKTSLIATVYDLLQDAPVAEHSFAGSATLVAFEKICHDARTSSRRPKPHTERTIVGADANFFHLDFELSEGRGLASLFLADRSGEDYLAASDELSNAQEFFELDRADTVTVLVNGDQLSNNEHRHEVKASTPQLVEALIEAQVIRPRQGIAVVLTKEDMVLASPHAERAILDFKQIVDAIKACRQSSDEPVRDFTIAASPESNTLVSRGKGVDGLLDYWLRPLLAEPSLPSAGVTSPRFIDHLTVVGG